MTSHRDYDLRFCTDGRPWYRRTEDGDWINVTTVEQVKRFLIVRKGISDDPPKNRGFSDVDLIIQDTEDHYRVDFAGEFAGFLTPGEYQIENQKALVIRGAPLIDPVEDDMEFYWSFIESSFPKTDQADVVHGWNLWTQLALRDDPVCKWRHGQALIMVGDTGLGKSAYQDIITNQITRRATDPVMFMTARTTFNEQMGRCEHLCLSDPGRSASNGRHFLTEIKKNVANIISPIHPKGKMLISMPGLHRMSITLNRDNESLDVLQGMAKSDLDKILVVDFVSAGKYAPNHPDGLRFWEWDAKMRKQTAAYICGY